MALVLAVMMVLGVATAFADSYTVTINPDSSDKATHEYEAYQIFAGDLSEDGTKLSNISWGSGIDQTKLDALATAINTQRDTTVEGYVALTASSSATDFANAMGELATSAGDSAKEQALADAIKAALNTTTAGTNGATAVSGLTAGYYFIQDSKNPTGTNGAITRYILQVVKSVTVTEKASVPTVEKKVKDKDDTAGTTTDWQDSADHDIGDSIDYQITATLPSKFADFDKYTVYTITDTMSEGLTPPEADDVTITILPSISTAASDIFQVAVSGQTMTISLKSDVDLKTIEGITNGTKFVVTYSAVLNDKAKLGKEGNPNEVELQYSNNPNWDGKGTPDTGKTPKDTVIVFTYKPVVNKVKSDETPLEGAEFTLYKEVSAEYTANAGETVKTGAAIKSELATSNSSINAAALKDDAKYVVKAMTKVSGSQTSFEFKGIDDGTYVLVETKIPDGYNAFVAETVVVTAKHDEESDAPQLNELKADKVITTVDKDGGTLTGKVVNNSGAVLPSTGGIGTTIFYVGGGLLALIAVVLLVTKRRMSAQ